MKKKKGVRKLGTRRMRNRLESVMGKEVPGQVVRDGNGIVLRDAWPAQSGQNRTLPPAVLKPGRARRVHVMMRELRK